MANLVDEVPWSDQLTSYDRAHFVIYIRLLDAKAEGIDAAEMARTVLGLDPARDPDGARRMVESHLRRAEWMTVQGYKDLLKSPRPAG